MTAFAAVDPLPIPFVSARIVGDNIDSDAYHRTEIERGDPQFPMSNSNLREILTNAHRWRLGYESEDTKSTEWGNLLDCMVLTPGEFEKRFAVCPETYLHTGMKCPSCGSVTDSQKCAKCKTAREPISIQKPWSFAAEICADWKAGQGSKQIVKAEDHKLAQNAVKFVFGHPEAAALINCSRKQVMVVGEYHDKETDLVIPVKALLDLVPAVASEKYGKVLADFKTTPNACEGAWTKKVWERGSHIQAAFFSDLYVAATGEDRTDWQHIVQETPPPWEVTVWPLSADFVNIGRGQYHAALVKYCACLKSGVWPGYSSRRGVIDPLPWMLNEA
jgi:hypothetical protein